MDHKKLLLFFLIFILILINGCAGDIPTEGTPSTVAPISTEPTGMSREEWEATYTPTMWCSLGFCGSEEGYDYAGGELHIQLQYKTVGYQENGLGIFLFLDGQIQPYRIAGEDTYSYLHTIYPEDNRYEYTTLDVWLIPVTGTEGKQLEMQVACISWPEYFLNMGMNTCQHTLGTTGSARTVYFRSDPEPQTLPEITDRVVSWEITREALTDAELAEWSPVDMLHRHEYEYSLKYNPYNYCRNGGILYSFSPGDYLTFRYESTGNTLGRNGLVIFVDNEPVSVQPEDLICFQNEDGKRTVIEVSLDLSDFDGSSVIYAFLLGQNYFQEGGGAYEIFRETRQPYYLSDAQDLNDLMGWE